MARLHRLAFALLMAAAVVFLTAAVAQDTPVEPGETTPLDLEVVQVQVLHRHGARAGLTRNNASLICTEAPCGYLTWAGIEMLTNTGAFLRSRYNTDSTVVSTPMFPSPNYDLDVAYSRSTDVLRTLQSAEAFLRGFFPNATSLYAAIHTRVEATDLLLNTNAQPWLKFFYSNNRPLVRAICNPLTDELFPDWTELTEISKEIYLEGYCSTYDTRSDCVRTLFDIAAAKMAVGELDQYPLLQASFEKIQRITRVLFAYEYHYNHSDPLMFRQGGRGQQFLKQLVQNMEDNIAGTNTFKLLHYSAHDTTLAPVWGTLGDDSETAMLPLFAQTLVAELLKSTSTGAMHVRLLRGNPGQSPDTNFTFTWDPTWTLQCMDAWGVAYYATNNTCPYEDFKRYIRWSEPGDARGYCYLDADSWALIKCPVENTVYNTPATATVTSDCAFYRATCPSFACPLGYTLNVVSNQCVCSTDACLDGTSTAATAGGARAATADATTNGADATAAAAATDASTVSHSSGLSTGAVVGVSLGTFCAGAVLAVALTAAVCLCANRRRNRSGFVQLHDSHMDKNGARDTEAV